MSIYDQAHQNLEYWRQWARNRNNLALQLCQLCPWSGRLQSCNPPVHLRRDQLCLDCHGRLRELATYFFRCELCKVAHGFSGGNSSPYARFHRSGLLTVARGEIELDYSDVAKLSDYPPFQKWLSRRSDR